MSPVSPTMSRRETQRGRGRKDFERLRGLAGELPILIGVDELMVEVGRRHV